MISEIMLPELRRLVEARLSPNRFSHTLGVERLAAFLGNMLIPMDTAELRAAALLHDIAKEIPIEDQIKMLSENKFSLTEEDKKTPGVIHSFTAPIIIKRDFPEFATQRLEGAVRKHTVGSSGMSIFDKIIFISDYAEDTRVYDSCRSVRAFLLKDFSELSYEERLARLNDACIESVKGVIEAIKRAGRPINSRIIKTYDFLMKQK